jgi:integrase
MAKITKRTVDALASGAMVWDHGFGVKANADGTRSYLLSYRIGRRKRRVTIGTHGAPWTVETARKRSRELMHGISNGVDPLAMRTATRTAPTVRELAERFMTEHVTPKRKATTARTYRGYLDNDVLPALGTRAVTDVTREDIARLHHRLRKTPAHANRVIAMCSKLFNLAERWGLRPDGSNPCRHVEKYPEQARQRYLSAAEFKRLGAVLAAAQRGPVVVDGEPEPVRLSPMALAAIGLLVFTGARRSEVLTLRWGHVDLERGVLTLPTSKTGFKVIHLNAPAVTILNALPRVEGNPYVLPGVRHGQHLVNVTETWYVVRALAGIKDVRIHDLRHAFASVAVGAGLGLPMIGALLGHTQPGTTARYAHLAHDPLKVAAELVGERIVKAMEAPHHT